MKNLPDMKPLKEIQKRKITTAREGFEVVKEMLENGHGGYELLFSLRDKFDLTGGEELLIDETEEHYELTYGEDTEDNEKWLEGTYQCDVEAIRTIEQFLKYDEDEI